LVFDDKYRVLCWPAPGGDMVLEARLTELPEDDALCESVMRNALQSACRRIHTHSDALVLSEMGNWLMLQQRVAAEAAADDFENELEAFVNAVAGWRQLFYMN
jgi:hypothetical protein